MLGMDGWALLQRLRETEATARMPVAMMAGVLDIVDPEKLRLAPIQGFLKKPVELRDLGDRVRRLLETPVAAPDPDADLLVLEPGDLLAEAPESPESPRPGNWSSRPRPSSWTPRRPPPPFPNPWTSRNWTWSPCATCLRPPPLSRTRSRPPRPPRTRVNCSTVPEFLLSDTLPEAVPPPPSGPDLEVFDALDAAEFHFADEPAGEQAADLPDLGPAADETAPAARKTAVTASTNHKNWRTGIIRIIGDAVEAARVGLILDDSFCRIRNSASVITAQ